MDNLCSFPVYNAEKKRYMACGLLFGHLGGHGEFKEVAYNNL